jgi:hypothetical protein
MKVVLAGPSDLDRSATHLAREQRRLKHEIGFRFPAEAAAEQGDVDRYTLRLEPELLRQLVSRATGALHRGPCLALAVAQVGSIGA